MLNYYEVYVYYVYVLFFSLSHSRSLKCLSHRRRQTPSLFLCVCVICAALSSLTVHSQTGRHTHQHICTAHNGKLFFSKHQSTAAKNIHWKSQHKRKNEQFNFHSSLISSVAFELLRCVFCNQFIYITPQTSLKSNNFHTINLFSKHLFVPDFRANRKWQERQRKKMV